MSPPSPLAPDLRKRFMIREDIAFLNHGSFGAVPRVVFDAQTEWRRRLEAEPIELIGRRWPALIEEAKGPVAGLLRMSPADFGFVTNATEGVNAVLYSLRLRPGEEILTTSHVYNAVRMAMRNKAALSGATYVELPVTTPIADAHEITRAIAGALTERTRLVVVDHVTSPTALVFPIREIAAACEEFGRRHGTRIDLLIDGAHAPGMLDLDVPATGATFYTGNLHKWCCGPKGSAFLWVRPDRSAEIHPCVVSHKYGSPLAEEFGWQGTRDGSAWMTVPAALAFMNDLGWDRVRAHNNALAAWAHQMLAAQWGLKELSPPDGRLLGSMATLPLPGRLGAMGEAEGKALQSSLYHEGRVEVPLFQWQGTWHFRVSAQVYNREEDYHRLAEALEARL